MEKFVPTVRVHLNKLLEVGIELPSDILAYLVLFKFPPSLKSMQSQIMHGVGTITVEYVLNHLTQHKNEIKATKEEATSKSEISLYNRDYPRCTNCVHNDKVRNHKREECWSEFPHLRPANPKTKRPGKKTEEEVAHFFSLFCGSTHSDSLGPNSFVLDSGCSVHLLNDRQYFSDISTDECTDKIKTGKP